MTLCVSNLSFLRKFCFSNKIFGKAKTIFFFDDINPQKVIYCGQLEMLLEEILYDKQLVLTHPSTSGICQSSTTLAVIDIGFD